ncbi:D-alanyl-D-alanine carboxypeptidase family protein [Novosphingobium sp. PC22D]|uniref:D-alanyl-D-alanine carboxypeptidase family protein n=1 Tax=Novosphingobium sp. PC22D TaxID=1962403 RepID=UPI001F0B1905|nr:D-alanyl-D-alanine carboxypeptidase family protein [Novosphingobium sp. PC22D]
MTACVLLVSSATALAAAPPVPPEIEDIPVTLLVDIGSGQVLQERRADVSFAPASMTKVMTTFVAFEEYRAGRLPLHRRFPVDAKTAREWFAKGTSMYLEGGDAPTTDQLLHGIMTASANDAAIVLAKGYAGSVDGWSFLMNDAAKRLGMTRSHFNTPNGWPDEGRTYVSARDLARLGEAMIVRYPGLYHRYAGVKYWQFGERILKSHDPTVGVIPGADGIKTGYTADARYCFLGSAERRGRRLVMVVGGAPTTPKRNAAARALLEWGFSQWTARPLFDRGEPVSYARVQDGDLRRLPLVADRKLHAAVPKQGGGKVRLTVRYRGPLVAPIAKGSKVADLEIAVDGTRSGHVPLYAGEAVGIAGPVDRLVNGVMNVFS